jgi:hypothetical protein
MATFCETVAADRWLLATLNANSALVALVGTKIYGYLAPNSAVAPYVVFEYEDGDDEQGVGGARVLSALRYKVVAVGETLTFGSIEGIAKQIDAALHGKQGAISGGGYVNECIRIGPVAGVEPIDGNRQFRHLGGRYQLRVSE